MNVESPASAQITSLQEIELWLRAHPDYRERINDAVFRTANASKSHPHDIAIYILVRTASL